MWYKNIYSLLASHEQSVEKCDGHYSNPCICLCLAELLEPGLLQKMAAEERDRGMRPYVKFILLEARIALNCKRRTVVSLKTKED